MSLAVPEKIGDYYIASLLGTGSYGSVYECYQESGFKYAIKIINKKQLKRWVQQEIKAMQSIKNMHIVQLYDIFYYNEYPCLIMELCEEGTLVDYIYKQEDHHLNEEQAMRIFVKILDGFKSIHAAGFIHRDLKLENILIKNSIVKITDFGLACKSSSAQVFEGDIAGTLQYMAPEILKLEQYNYQVDIWSLGVVLFAMLYFDFPFNGTSRNSQLERINKLCANGFNIREVIKNKGYKADISAELEDFFAKVFVPDPNKRINFVEVYNHPIIQKYYSQCSEMAQFYNDKFSLEQLHSSCSLNDAEEQPNVYLVKLIQLSQGRIKAGEMQGEIQSVAKYMTNVYQFLIDTYQNISQDTIFNLDCDQNELLLFKYFIVKQILYFIVSFWQKSAEWRELLNESSQFIELHANLGKEVEVWCGKLSALFKQLQNHAEIKNKEIIEALVGQIEVDETTNFLSSFKIPHCIKLPYRAMLLHTAGRLYQHADKYINQQKSLEEQKHVSNKNQMSNHFIDLYMKSATYRMRHTVRILICSVVNRVFDHAQEAITFKFFKPKQILKQSSLLQEFIQWINGIDLKESTQIIQYLLETYFRGLNLEKFYCI